VTDGWRGCQPRRLLNPTIVRQSAAVGRIDWDDPLSHEANEAAEVWTRKLRELAAATRCILRSDVLYCNAAGVSRVVGIVGTDEVGLDRTTSFVSHLARVD